MKTPYFSLVTAAMLGLTSFANAADEAEHYKQLVSTSIFTANNLHLQTGWYDMDGGNTGNDPEFTNANFVGSYYFGELGDTFRPFILGGFGFSEITQDNSVVGGSIGDITLDSTYYQIGGGMNYNPNENLGLVLGASALWMGTDGDYNGVGASTDMYRYFNQDSDTTIYDLFAAINYRTVIDGYKPYAGLTLHYLSINYDFDISDTTGWNTELTAGVFTPTLTMFYDLPVRGKIFAVGTWLDNDLSDNILFGDAYTAGASLLWKVGPLIPLFNNAFKDTELAANLQATIGDNDLSGWKASLSFHIEKF